MHVKAVLSYVELGAQGGLTPELTAALKALWADSGVQVSGAFEEENRAVGAMHIRPRRWPTGGGRGGGGWYAES